MIYLYASARQKYGRLAQLVRASALQAGGRESESLIAHHIFYAEIAQSGRATDL